MFIKEVSDFFFLLTNKIKINKLKIEVKVMTVFMALFGFLMSIFIEVVFPIIIIVSIVKAVSKRKKDVPNGTVESEPSNDVPELTNQETTEGVVEDSANEHEDHTRVYEKTPTYCEYCGAVVPEGKHRCPSCSAKLK